MSHPLDDGALADRDLLVCAAIAAPERATLAWTRLTERRGGSAGVLEWVTSGAEQRLLPLLGDRAELLMLDDHTVEACRSATAEAWALNERLVENLAPWLMACTERGVTTVAIKGLGLLGDVYPVHIHRPIGDADVLVPLDHLTAAFDAMREVGWTVPRRPGFAFRAASHASTVALPRGGFLDLHWRPGAIAPYGVGPSDWTLVGTRPVDPAHPLAGTGLSRPAAERHLLIVAAHGGRVLNAPVAHPMVDLAAMLAASPSLDSDAMVAAAAETPFALRAAVALARTRDVLDIDLPIDPHRMQPGTPHLRRVEERTMVSEQRSMDLRRGSWRARVGMVRRTAGWAPLPTALVTLGFARPYVETKRRPAHPA